MNYAESLAYLTKLGNEVLTMKFGLDTIGRLVREMGDVHQAFSSVLVAGTNGKGSVARQIASIAAAAGIRSGLYTSPHLIRINERIAVNGRDVPPEEFAASLTAVVEAIERTHPSIHPTFFETVTATAMEYFARQAIELAVLEIGMGGRLDSCNVVDPLVSVITPIGLDHQQYLGSTLTAIAREKAGILRSRVPAWSAEQLPEVRAALEEAAGTLDTRLNYVDRRDIEVLGEERGRYRFRMDGSVFRPGSSGICQVANGALAIRAAQELARQGLPIRKAHLQEGLAAAVTPGVLQEIQGDPPLLIDGVHNPQAAQNLAEFVDQHLPHPRALVFGIMADKDASTVLRTLLPLFERVFFTRIDSPRAELPETLRDRFCSRGEVVPEPLEAVRRAQADSAAVVVAGSFYLAGQLLEALENEG